MDKQKMKYDLFTDKKSITIIELKNNRLMGIYEIINYPLFKKTEIKKLEYPTRQQLHSKRYYVTKTQEHIATLQNVTIDEAITRAKDLLKQISLYEVTL